MRDGRAVGPTPCRGRVFFRARTSNVGAAPVLPRRASARPPRPGHRNCRRGSRMRESGPARTGRLHESYMSVLGRKRCGHVNAPGVNGGSVRMSPGPLRACRDGPSGGAFPRMRVHPTRWRRRSTAGDSGRTSLPSAARILSVSVPRSYSYLLRNQHRRLVVVVPLADHAERSLAEMDRVAGAPVGDHPGSSDTSGGGPKAAP